MRNYASIGWFGAAIALCLMAACSDDDSDPPPCFVAEDAGLAERAPRFTDVAGNHQTGFVGGNLEAVTVRLSDDSGAPRAGVEVRFAALDGARFGAGSVTASQGTLATDDSGEATFAPTGCEQAGGVTIEARPTDHSAPSVRFRLTCFPAPDATHRPLTVVHFNDFHTHMRPWKDKAHPLGGLSRLATLVQRLRANAAAAGVTFFAANCGDDFENTLVHDVDGGLTEILVLEDLMGVDVYQVGNHDFEFGVPVMQEVFGAAADRFVDGDKGHPMKLVFGSVDPATLYEPVATECASTIAAGWGDDGALFQRTWVMDASDLRLGVMGVVTDDAIYTQVPGDPAFFAFFGVANPDAQGLTFFPPDPRDSDYFAEGLDSLDTQDVDFVIVTSHAGLGVVDRVNLPQGSDHLIAEYAEGATSGRVVDTVLSAHSHVKVNHAVLWDNPAGRQTTIIQADEGGLYLSRQDFWVDTVTNTAELVDSRLLQVDQHLEPDADTAAAVADLEDQVLEMRPAAFEPVAYNPWQLSSKIEAVSGLGRLIARSFLDALNRDGVETDAALAVASLYRVDLEEGLLTSSDLYDELPLHKMLDTHQENDTITYLEFKPGLWDVSFFGLAETERYEVPGILYFAELMYGLFEVLDVVYPPAAKELNVDIVQLEGLSFDIDLTAPPVHRIDPDSFLVGGEPVDPERTYRVAIMESMAAVVGQLAATLLWSEHSDTGVDEPLINQDPVTARYYFDSQIPLWEALDDYVTRRAAEGCGAIPVEDVEPAGEVRTTQPDPTLRHTTLVAEPRVARPGDLITITVDLTNYGEVDVDDVRVALWLERTPWDQTDDPDGLEAYEGLGADDRGSQQLQDEQWVAVRRWPHTSKVTFEWTVPDDLPPYRYPLFVELTDVTSSETDPNTGEPYTDAYPGNNGGPNYPVYLFVTRE